MLKDAHVSSSSSGARSGNVVVTRQHADIPVQQGEQEQTRGQIGKCTSRASRCTTEKKHRSNISWSDDVVIDSASCHLCVVFLSPTAMQVTKELGMNARWVVNEKGAKADETRCDLRREIDQDRVMIFFKQKAIRARLRPHHNAPRSQEEGQLTH